MPWTEWAEKILTSEIRVPNEGAIFSIIKNYRNIASVSEVLEFTNYVNENILAVTD